MILYLKTGDSLFESIKRQSSELAAKRKREAHNRRMKRYKQKQASKASIAESNRKYHETNKESNKARFKQHYENNKETIKEKAQQHYENNKEVIKEKAQQHYENNKEVIKEKAQQHYENNKEVIKEKARQHYAENKESIREAQQKYYKTSLKKKPSSSDPNTAQNLRSNHYQQTRTKPNESNFAWHHGQGNSFPGLYMLDERPTPEQISGALSQHLTPAGKKSVQKKIINVMKFNLGTSVGWNGEIDEQRKNNTFGIFK
jgi:hypothetical protein